MSKETKLDLDSFLLSETDEKGVIRYANDEFCKIAEYNLEELIGQPHSIIRHPDMPKAVFQDLWDTVKAGKAWKSFIKNKTKNNNYYWVFATVFPFIGLSPAIAPVMGGAIHALAGWRAIFFFVFLLGIALILLIYFYLPETKNKNELIPFRAKSIFKHYKDLLASRIFWGYALSPCFVSFALSLYFFMNQRTFSLWLFFLTN